MIQSTAFYGVLLTLLSMVSDSSEVSRLVLPTPRVINYDSAIAVQKYIADENLVMLKELNKK